MRIVLLATLFSGLAHAMSCTSPCVDINYSRGTSSTVTLSVVPTSGNMLHVWACAPAGGGAPTTPTSSPTLTWTNATADDGHCATYFSPNVASGSVSVTDTCSACGTVVVIASAWSSPQTSSPLDVSAASFTNGTSWNSANVTTTQNNDLFVGLLECNSATNCGFAVTGWTAQCDSGCGQDAGGGLNMALYSKTTNTSGTNSFSGTATTATQDGAFDTFKVPQITTTGSTIVGPAAIRGGAIVR